MACQRASTPARVAHQTPRSTLNIDSHFALHRLASIQYLLQAFSLAIV